MTPDVMFLGNFQITNLIKRESQTIANVLLRQPSWHYLHLNCIASSPHFNTFPLGVASHKCAIIQLFHYKIWAPVADLSMYSAGQQTLGEVFWNTCMLLWLENTLIEHVVDSPSPSRTMPPFLSCSVSVSLEAQEEDVCNTILPAVGLSLLLC